MDETVSDDLSSASASTTTDVRQTRTATSACKVCDALARYSYYGAIVCQSCKVFFKRNAEFRQEQLKCHFDNDCVINVSNRHTCSSCRLKRCFASGMCIELIRSSRAKDKKGSEENKPTTGSAPSASTTVATHNNRNEPAQIPISNLLRSDQSTLSVDQWNLLSNLVHCFDEYSGFSFVERYIQEQNALPVKVRFRYSSAVDFFTSMLSNVQLVFEKNRDFLSLSSPNRSTLLRTTVQYASSIGGLFVARQHHLLHSELLYQSAEMIFRPNAVALSKWIIDRLDPDDTFVKLILAIFAFSTVNCTIYVQPGSTDLGDVKAILSVQNMYAELVWRYLLHKYNHRESVIRFSNLIKYLVSINNVIIEANESQQFVEMMDNIIERTEQTFRLS